MKILLVRKATGNHLVESTSLENLRALSLVSAKLEIEYAAVLRWRTSEQLSSILVELREDIFHSILTIA